MDFLSIKNYLKKEPGYRLQQIEKSIYKDLIQDWMQASSLPLSLRMSLNQNFPLKIKGKIIDSGNENSMKAIITLEDGKNVETVLMRHNNNRNTICLSSQVGCGMNCSFCITGQNGLERDLKDYEIIDQVLFIARVLKAKNENISNVVFMGMGEPFLNYENVISAVYMLNDKGKFNIGARKISISTCGIPEKINLLANEKMQINLAVSLNASNDSARTKIMPINRLHPISELVSSIKKYILKTNRRVMFEYVLIDGLNDSKEHALELAYLLRGILCLVNLIPYNGLGELKRPSRRKINDFKKMLSDKAISVTERYRFGEDINAACGRLTSKHKDIL